MLIDRENIAKHRAWIALVLVATFAAIAWYVAHARTSGRLPGGASLPGLIYGVVGGAIMIFEFLLWPRKRFRRWRLGSAKAWLKAHIWLGLLTVPLILLHSGFRWGGQLSTILAALFIVVIASGIFGLAMQQWLPRLMLTDLPAETIASQIDHVARTLYLDAEQMVAAICGVEPSDAAAWRGAELVAVAGQPVRSIPSQNLTMGGAHSNVSQLAATPSDLVEPLPGSEPLQQAFVAEIGPFLWSGGRRRGLGDAGHAVTFFGQLRAALSPAAHPALAVLEDYCNQRRQFDRQLRLHRLLHGWLLVHLPLSVVLVVLMFLHAYMALKY